MAARWPSGSCAFTYSIRGCSWATASTSLPARRRRPRNPLLLRKPFSIIRFLLNSKPGATTMPDHDRTQRIPINELHQEPGAKELTESPEMEPYLNFAAALMQGHDPEPELEAIRQLPLEERYVWRVASALKWAFADLDDLSVRQIKTRCRPKISPG